MTTAPASPIGSFDAVTIDCADPVALAGFWCEVLATKIDTTEGEPIQYVDLLPAAGAPTMRFQRVPEPRSSKVRIHLDILVDDLQVAIERVEELGAKQAVDGYYSEFRCTWQVMLDPEGNEFCLVFKED